MSLEYEESFVEAIECGFIWQCGGFYSLYFEESLPKYESSSLGILLNEISFVPKYDVSGFILLM
jgi:hypothetical protein